MEKYQLFLNGKVYGYGDLSYMKELITDYVVTNEIYGKDQCEFKIVRKESKEKKKLDKIAEILNQ